MVFIHGGKPVKISALTTAFGSKLKTGDFWCSNPGRAKSREKEQLKCETLFVDDVWMSDIHFDRASYSQGTNGDLRELTASKQGKCEIVLRTYFDLIRYIYRGMGRSIPAKVTDEDVFYDVPVPNGPKLKSNSVSLRFVDGVCHLSYDFVRTQD